MNLKKRSAQAILLGLGGILIFSFQNMSLKDFAALEVDKVDESGRRDQAKELLGIYYRKSPARKLESQKHLNYLIFKEIEKSLGKQWQNRTLELTRTLISESREYEFDPIFILAVIRTESKFDPTARGDAGEIGLMQILPQTAEWIAKKYKLPWGGKNTLYNPATNVRIGIRYFDYLRSTFSGTAYHYLPAYNMGPKNMQRVANTTGSIDSSGRPRTREYAMKVMKNYSAIYEQLDEEQINLSSLGGPIDPTID